MSDLVGIGFDNEVRAFEMRVELAKLQKEYLIETGRVVHRAIAGGVLA